MNRKGKKYFDHTTRFDNTYASYYIRKNVSAFSNKNFPPPFFSIVSLFAEDSNYNLKDVTLLQGCLSIKGVYKGEKNTLYLRYKYNEDISIVVAQVAFIHKRKGYMTKLYEILCHMKKIYKLNEVIIECVNTLEMKNWCDKNGLVQMPNNKYNYISKEGYKRLMKK